MKRELSSNQTFFLKIILPIIFIVLFLAAVIGLILGYKKSEIFITIVIIMLAFPVGIVSMYFTLMRYKKVSIDDDFLYVSNYRNEIKIALSNISDVTETKWIRTRPITIHLKSDSEFGRKIIFTPKMNGFRVFADNPIVVELKESANLNKR